MTNSSWAERGMALVAQDCRGRYDFGGEYVRRNRYDEFWQTLSIPDDPALDTEPVVARQTVRHDAEFPSHVLLPVVPA